MEALKNSKAVAGSAVNGDDAECKAITNGLRTIGQFSFVNVIRHCPISSKSLHFRQF